MKLNLIWSVAAACALMAPGIARATTQAVPTALANLEGSAEDTYDLALAGDFAKVSKNSGDIKTNWTKFRTQASRDGAPQKAISAMDRSVLALVTASAHAKPGDNVRLARIADAVSADMDQFYTVYHPTTPPGIMKLDFLGRELVLDGMANDFALASTQVGEVNGSWKSLRPLILRAGGAKEASLFDEQLRGIESHLGSRDGTALVTDAKASLENLDAMEKLYP